MPAHHQDARTPAAVLHRRAQSLLRRPQTRSPGPVRVVGTGPTCNARLAGFPPVNLITVNSTGGTMATDLRAERRVVESAAAVLRSRTAQAVYAGFVHPEMAFSLCSILDEIGRHWRDVDAGLRDVVLEQCREILKPS